MGRGRAPDESRLCNLNRATPDIAAAERFAQSALTLVPYWHYVRDILMVQIQKAKSPH